MVVAVFCFSMSNLSDCLYYALRKKVVVHFALILWLLSCLKFRLLYTHCNVTANVLQSHCIYVAAPLHLCCSDTALRFAVTLQHLCSGAAKSAQWLCSGKLLVVSAFICRLKKANPPAFEHAGGYKKQRLICVLCIAIAWVIFIISYKKSSWNDK